VSRRNPLTGGILAFKRKEFDVTKQLFVRFSGETVVDEGGPSREFFRMVLRAIKDSSLFEGGDQRKYFARDAAGNKK
jgi:hypothetical protein